MGLISITAVSINGSAFSTPISMMIEDVNIKYVFQHKKINAYDQGATDIIYYDAMSAKLSVIVVTDKIYTVWGLYNGFKLITSERIDSVDNIKPMLVNKSSFGYSVALSPKDDASLSIIVYGTLVLTFEANEIITGSTSGATAKIVTDDATGLMVVHHINGTLAALETITGATSGATAAITSYTAAPQKYYQYENGHGVARKKKDIVAYESQAVLNYAITGVSLANNTFTIAGDHAAILTHDVPFFVTGSTGNDGLYTVVSSVYGTATVITVLQLIQDATIDGTIKDA